MADYQPKTEGISYLRHAIISQKKRPATKFLTIPMEQAEKIISQAEGFVPRKAGWDARRNSERAAALILGLEPKELVSKLEAPDLAKLQADLAEARTKLKAYEESGDKMFEYLKRLDGTTNGMLKCRAEWYDLRTKK